MRLPNNRNITLQNDGKPFEEEINRSLKIVYTERKLPGWWERIPDVSDYVGRSCPHCHAPIIKCACCSGRLPTIGMMPGKRMGDFHGGYKGYWLMECKTTSWEKGFPTANLKKHQYESLMNNVMADNRSYLAVCDRSVPRKPTAYIMPFIDYCNVSLRKYIVKWDVLADISTIVQRTPYEGKPYYDLGFMFD